MNDSKAVNGVLMAGVIGLALGVLTAPKKGSEIQKSILNSLDEFAEDLLEVKQKVTEIVAQMRAEFKEDVGSTRETLKNQDVEEQDSSEAILDMVP